MKEKLRPREIYLSTKEIEINFLLLYDENRKKIIQKIIFCQMNSTCNITAIIIKCINNFIVFRNYTTPMIHTIILIQMLWQFYVFRTLK